jgi:hypothetical protein
MAAITALFKQKHAAEEAASKLHDEVGAEGIKYDADQAEEDRKSIASLANRAQNTAKQVFNAGYQAFGIPGYRSRTSSGQDKAGEHVACKHRGDPGDVVLWGYNVAPHRN